MSIWKVLVLAGAVCGCDAKMKPAECDRLRGEAFDLLNKAQHCSTDADCLMSPWPGCPRPISLKTESANRDAMSRSREGKCEEPVATCGEGKTAYCKQGLCALREQGITSASEITIQ